MFMALDQLPPQKRLPVSGFPLLPLKHHFRPKKKILIIEIGNSLRELEAFEIGSPAPKIDPESLKCRLLNERRQNLHDAPGHDFRIKKRRFREVLEDALEDLLDKGVGKGETAVGADAVALGKLETYPALHALALNNDDLLVKGRRQGFPEHPGKLISQDL
jgi:hypothetical protein